MDQNLTQLLITGGVITVAGSIIVAIINSFTNRKPAQANYAQAIVETSNAFTARLDENNQKLEAKANRLEEKADRLERHCDTLENLLRIAIPLLQASGHDVAEMRAVLEHAREV